MLTGAGWCGGTVLEPCRLWADAVWGMLPGPLARRLSHVVLISITTSLRFSMDKGTNITRECVCINAPSRPGRQPFNSA